MNNNSKSIEEYVENTPFIDTHEHLIDEHERLNSNNPFIPCNDWTSILGHYTTFDFIAAGMNNKEVKQIKSKEISPLDKWKIIDPYWNAIKHTGSGQVSQKTIEKLYGVSEISTDNINEINEQYLKKRKPGFYKDILKKANVKLCIVNPPGRPFKETLLPSELFQDINASGMININIEQYNENILPEIKELNDWLAIINWWFDKYSDKAVGIKIGNAYFRRLDFKRVKKDEVETIFIKHISEDEINISDKKKLQDYLFWYIIDLATKKDLPVKLHTGHQAMNNFMNLENVMYNPADCADLCKQSPDTKFIFFHIAYPFYEPMISLAKHYSNAYIDMCWSWSLNPIASKDFLKKYILSSPINKLLVFGGDDLYIENIIGHTHIARKGISLAINELINEEWISENDAYALINKIMYENAEEIYKLKQNENYS